MEMIPVGNTGIQPDPLGSISKLIAAKSGMIGLQQQQQNLQTGQYAQQSAQSASQLANQEQQEVQGLAQFTLSAANDPSYQNADGSANVQKYQQGAMKVAPVFGQKYIGQMTANFNGAVENRKALLGLTKEQQGMVQGGFQSIAQGADATSEISRLRGISDDKGYQNMLDNILSHKPSTGMMPDAQGKQAESQWAAALSAHLGGPALGTPSSVDTGGNIQPGTTSPYTGAFNPAGAIAKTIPAGQTRNAAGQIVNVAPISGALSMPGQGGGGQGGVNPASPAVTAQTGMAEGDNARYAQISQEGTNAQTGSQLADQVAQLAQQVRTGKLSGEWADRLAVLQQHDPSITNRQMLSKYAAQLKTMAEQNASTDASRSQIEQGMPSPDKMDPDAVGQAAQYVGGIFRMRGARQAYADQYVKNSGGTSVGIRGADDSFMSAADPTTFAYSALPAGAQRQQFLAQHFGGDPAKLQQFAARLNQVKHYAGAIQ